MTLPPEVPSSSLPPVHLMEDFVPSKPERPEKARELDDAAGRSRHGGKASVYKDEGKFSCLTGGGVSKQAFFGQEGGAPSLEGYVYPEHCLGFHISGEQLDVKEVSHDTDIGKRVAKGNIRTACISNDKGGSSESHEDYTGFLPGLCDEIALRCLAFVPLSDHRRLAMVSHRYRRLIRSSLLLDLRRAYKIVEQWVCIYTGDDYGWMAFDPKQNLWRNLPPAVVDWFYKLSKPRVCLFAGAHLLWMDQEFYDFTCYKYDLITNCWERGPPMVNSRRFFASASCGEFAFVAGGFKVELDGYNGLVAKYCSNSAERYDARVGIWEPLPAMETPRQRCSGVFMDGKFYVIGGEDSDHNPLTSGEVYDPVTKAWKAVPGMYISSRSNTWFEPSPPLFAVANNELYAMEDSTNLLKHFNKSTNTWKEVGPVPVRRDLCNGWGLTLTALGDELFVIGGYLDPSHRREGVAVFSWKPRFDVAAPEGPLGADWKLVNLRVKGYGSFVDNCAVLSR